MLLLSCARPTQRPLWTELNVYTQSKTYGCLWFLDYLLASILVLDECGHNQKNNKNMWADKTHEGKK